MKRLISVVCLVIFMFGLSSCKTFSKREYSLDEYTASEISKIENISSFNDETIKVLSVIYRNNLKDKNNLSISHIDNRILSLTKQTNNFEFSKNLNLNTHLKSWSEIINKAEILEFFKTRDISLANVSDITISSNENNFAEFITVTSNKVDFIEFAKYFNLISNKNINVECFNSYIKIYGYGNAFNFNIDLSDIEKLALDGLTFDKIIENISK